MLSLAVGCVPGETRSFQVERAGATYDVRVWADPELPPPPERDVLVVLDGDWYAGMAERVVHGLVGEGYTPPLVVSIGYAGANHRTVDYTPTEMSEFPSGGLSAFADLLEEEVLPRVEADGSGGAADRRLLFGHSLGGLAVTHLWLEHPELADRLVAASPSYWWDDGMSFDAVAEAAPAGRIVVTAGSVEAFGAVALAEEMAHRLQALPDVTCAFTVNPGRDHSSNVRPSLEHGLRELLAR